MAADFNTGILLQCYLDTTTLSHMHFSKKATRPGPIVHDARWRDRCWTKGCGARKPMMRLLGISLPPLNRMMPGGPNRPKRFIRALSSALLAVTSTWIRRTCFNLPLTAGWEKVKRSISLQDTHQSA